jgi:hypothetical protein
LRPVHVAARSADRLGTISATVPQGNEVTVKGGRKVPGERAFTILRIDATKPGRRAFK